MQFIITKHAEKRLRERKAPSPSKANLIKVSKRVAKKVRESCKESGYNTSNNVYFATICNGIEFVYVCTQKDIGVFYLITVLKYVPMGDKYVKVDTKEIGWKPADEFIKGDEVLAKNDKGELCYGCIEFDSYSAYIIDGLCLFSDVTHCISKEDLLKVKEIE